MINHWIAHWDEADILFLLLDRRLIDKWKEHTDFMEAGNEVVNNNSLDRIYAVYRFFGKSYFS